MSPARGLVRESAKLAWPGAAICALLGSQPVTAQEAAPGPEVLKADPPGYVLLMRDGQLKSHRLEVFVTADVRRDQNPRLRLFRSHAVTERKAGEEDPLAPVFVAPGQEWRGQVDGADLRRTGTVLLFDLNDIDFGYKAMVRVRPALTWTDGGVERIALGTSDVNVGDITATMLWTAAMVAIALSVVLVLARLRKDHPALFLTGVDGHLSLAQTQVACWTGDCRCGGARLRHDSTRDPDNPGVGAGVDGGVAAHGRACGTPRMRRRRRRQPAWGTRSPTNGP